MKYPMKWRLRMLKELFSNRDPRKHYSMSDEVHALKNQLDEIDRKYTFRHLNDESTPSNMVQHDMPESVKYQREQILSDIDRYNEKINKHDQMRHYTWLFMFWWFFSSKN